MRSLRVRLTLGLAASSAVVMAVVAVVAVVLVSQFLQSRAESRLDAISARTVAALQATGGATLTTDELRRYVGAGADPGVAAGAVLIADGRALTSWGVASGDVATVAATTSRTPVTVESRYLAERVDVGGLGLRFRRGSEVRAVDAVVVTSDTAEQRGVVATVVGGTSIAAAIGASLLILLAAVIVGRGLRPLRIMAEHAEQIARGDRTTRLPTSRVGDPAIERLARTVNTAFDAQQDAENRMRSFVADASHELRSPLTAATGWVELYLRGGLADRQPRDDAMVRVHAQLHRMRQLVEELSTLARTDSGRPLTTEPVDLGSLAAEVVLDARVASPDREIRLRRDSGALVLGDEARLAQVVRNLVGNAVQHTPDDAVVTVTVSRGERQHRLVVADTGPGIPAEQVPHVFERFWRADSARDRESGGSGLGLAIVQALVAAHGGTIELASGAEAGTVFTVTLPALLPAARDR